MSDITKDQVKHIAHLSRLELTDEELDLYTNQLSKILDYASHLPELTPQSEHAGDWLRVDDDEVRPSKESPEELLKNAIAIENGFVKVPAILDKGDE